MVYTLICHAEVKPEFVQQMVAKLREAAAIYKKDKETIDWIVHQDEKVPTKFAIVERFEHESSQQYHLGNPYWATFNPAVEPWLTKPIEVLRFNEL
ncbi:hypothetical protein FIBSPDRAFT_853030 [Athelia psychrophila]|uniref:ABM domain-containing protein n=1 Tax=Athelia psychrophila TaxID=1759441 RepID=A0A166R2V5_9AGAM|nr:hypothetical protein FIBSPDRAFT_860169 [Fibularhizoctonia sp. CBS 109695]KZP27840.1 hypothetical protein FIBSPDRAFT_853030 [Fibularhizoctonia sp. CBS 109695]